MLWEAEEIDSGEFRTWFEQARQQQRNEAGDAFDPRAFEDKANKRKILEEMIDVRVLRLMAEHAGIAVSDAQVRAMIESVPAFQVDGKFNPP